MNYKIISKFVKDLKFKIPSAKSFFLLSKNISNYKINIDIKSNQVKENIIEVEISLFLNPTVREKEIIETKIVYSTLVEFEKKSDNKEEVEKIILIKIPTSVYPDIRDIFISLFEKSGFKEIKIEKIVDFEKLYRIQKSQ